MDTSVVAAAAAVLGSLVGPQAADRVNALIADAIAKGARLVAGGVTPGTILPATIVDHVTPNMRLYGEESFGPVATVVRVGSTDEAVRVANDTEYGLVAYLYTKDLSRGMRVSEKLDFGMIGLNRGLVSDPAAPFGGTKQSGLGREGAQEGMKEFLETQYVSVSW